MQREIKRGGTNEKESERGQGLVIFSFLIPTFILAIVLLFPFCSLISLLSIVSHI